MPLGSCSARCSRFRPWVVLTPLCYSATSPSSCFDWGSQETQRKQYPVVFPVAPCLFFSWNWPIWRHQALVHGTWNRAEQEPIGREQRPHSIEERSKLSSHRLRKTFNESANNIIIQVLWSMAVWVSFCLSRQADYCKESTYWQSILVSEKGCFYSVYSFIIFLFLPFVLHVCITLLVHAYNFCPNNSCNNSKQFNLVKQHTK